MPASDDNSLFSIYESRDGWSPRYLRTERLSNGTYEVWCSKPYFDEDGHLYISDPKSFADELRQLADWMEQNAND